MPLTDAERSRNYRKRKRTASDPSTISKLKQELSQKALRARLHYHKRVEAAKQDPVKLAQFRLTVRLAQRKARHNRKQRSATIETNSHNTEQQPYYKRKTSLGRAKKRVINALPRHPAGVVQVLNSLAKQFGLNFSHSTKPKPQSHPCILSEHKAAAHDFYLRDDISRPSSNARDYKSVRMPNGLKEKQQIRFLTLPITELYRLFKEEFPSIRIGRSLFFQLRPKWVQSVRKTRKHSCVCEPCANMQFLLDAIPRSLSFPVSIRDLISRCCCNAESAECFFNQCSECSNLKHIRSITESIPSDRLSVKHKYKQWGSYTPECKESSLANILDLLFSKLLSTSRTESFLAHTFIQRAQSRFFIQEKTSVTSSSFVLQCDFAENPNIIHQDEIPRAHFSPAQITLYTAVVWTPYGTESFALCSNYLKHDKDSVYVFTRSILYCLKRKHANFSTLSIWSDGSSSQFKNRFNLYDLTFLFESTQVHVRWNFFASHHGKGSADAIGATVKRQVQTKILSRTLPLDNTVTDAQSYAACAAQVCPSISIQYINAKEILSVKETLSSEQSVLKLSIPNLRKHYSFVPLNDRKLLCKRLSNCTTGTVFDFSR